MRENITDEQLQLEIHRLTSPSLHSLAFPKALEHNFEDDNAKERSYRLWWEGLLAILALNACLLVDLILMRDSRWQSVVFRTMLTTPLALFVNWIVRRNPKEWLREGSVAVGTTLICFLSMYAEGTATAITTAFGLMSVLLMVLFADVVMRLRLPYAATVTATLFAGGLYFLAQAPSLQTSEKIIGASLLCIGVAITMTASYSLERQERLSYLLFARGSLQTQELAQLNDSLRRLSTLDKLTGLPNRRAFDDRLEELWTECRLNHTQLSAILLDVDHFKVINDAFGHLYGDAVLQRIALLLPQALRGRADLVARFGGEEFVVLLPDAGPDTAAAVAERIRSLIEAAATPLNDKQNKDRVIWITVSCGVATCSPAPELDRRHLLEAADRALYDAKSCGRNRVSRQAVTLTVPDSASAPASA